MKNLSFVLLFTISSLFTFAQQKETRSLSSFSEVSAQEGIKVYLEKGSKEEARVVSDNIDLEDVLTEVRGSKLKIHLDGNNWKRVDVEVYVTYTKLKAISASSAGSIKAEDVINADGGDFEVDVSSAGRVKAAIRNIDDLDLDASSAGNADLKVEADEVTADLSSAGELTVSGSVVSQRIEASSSGRYRAEELASESAVVGASSGGSVRVKVSEKLDANASSGGRVRYSGSPKYMSSDTSSGGSVKKS